MLSAEKLMLLNSGAGGDSRGFPGGGSGREPICQCRRHKRRGFDPWVGKIPGGGHANLLKYSCLETPGTEKPGGLQSIGWQRVRHT